MPEESTAATVSASSQLAGVNPAASAPLLPAATTTTAPRDRASAMAEAYSAGQVLDPPPSDRFRIFAGVGLAGTPGTVPPAAQRMPSATSESDPPHAPSTRTGWILTSGAPPNTPIELFARAAIVPETCVPCQLEWPVPHQSPGSEASGSRPSPSCDESVDET